MEPGLFYDFIASMGVGFLGSLHCLGMCGPLILAYSLQIDKAQPPANTAGAPLFQHGIFHHLAFHLGRLMTYGFLGALGGLLFHLVGFDALFNNLRSGMTLSGGILMVLLGLALMRIIRMPGIAMWSFSGPKVKAWFGLCHHSSGPGSRIALGMAVGFLPCGLSWAMMVKAATTQNALTGFLVMFAFGLGTVPALLVPGISASLFSLRSRLVGERLAALSIMAMGVILIFKAARTFV
jgi:uncharacterized protein